MQGLHELASSYYKHAASLLGWGEGGVMVVCVNFPLTVTLSGTEFRGFLVIAHVPGQPLMLLGAFTAEAGNQQVIEECDTVGANMQAAIGHSQNMRDTSTTFSWTAPSDVDGTVDFRYV